MEISLESIDPKVHLSNTNYPVIKTSRSNRLLHRLVALAWIPNPNNFPVVMHLDDNRLNFKASNLRWASHKDNVTQASFKGRLKRSNRIWKFYNEASTYFTQGKTKNWVRKHLHLGVVTVEKFWNTYKNQSYGTNNSLSQP